MPFVGSGAKRTCAGVAIAATVLSLAACTMPETVGSLGDIQSSANQGQIVLVPLTAQTLPPPPPAKASFPAEFLQGSQYDYDRLGPGDHVGVRIYESGTPSVFGSSGVADLGELVVDETGHLYIPYAGSIQAAGRSIREVRADALRRLRTVVVSPQIEILPVQTRSRLVSVQGAASKPGAYPIERGRTRLGELLAEVAPDQKNPEMTQVTIRRDGRSASVRLSDIYANPDLDVPLQPGDSVILSQVVENVTVLGATGQQGTLEIPSRDFTLIQALGDAKGLNPEYADPRAVFVLRAQDSAVAPPLVYQVDFRRPEEIALANRFVMRPNDAIIVSNASFAQTRQLILAIAQVVTAGRNAALVVQ